MSKTLSLKEMSDRLLANPAVRTEYDAQTLEYQVADAMIRARKKAKLTQAELADRMGTSQSTIARHEGGKTLPSLDTLRRVAIATGQKIELTIPAF